MKPSHDQHNDFFAHRPIAGVAFEHNDAVMVVGGDHAGDSGSIVSIEELGEDPIYLIELGSGDDVFIKQSLLRLVEA
jgi:ribosomal protein S4E